MVNPSRVSQPPFSPGQPLLAPLSFLPDRNSPWTSMSLLPSPLHQGPPQPHVRGYPLEAPTECSTSPPLPKTRIPTGTLAPFRVHLHPSRFPSPFTHAPEQRAPTGPPVPLGLSPTRSSGLAMHLLLLNDHPLGHLWEDLSTSPSLAPRRSERAASCKKRRNPLSSRLDTCDADLVRMGDPKTLGKVRSLAADGAFSKALKHLTSEGMLDANDTPVVNQLRTLHPTRTLPPV
jgi:hypothetical protein